MTYSLVKPNKRTSYARRPYVGQMVKNKHRSRIVLVTDTIQPHEHSHRWKYKGVVVYDDCLYGTETGVASIGRTTEYSDFYGKDDIIFYGSVTLVGE